ncbi:histone deacetylase family protein [Vibrio viridaestus]|uniref:Histone deacetylase n=1 Tax=Vibrio viridaestus TaxID=2487322 RepID=A0A3N9TIR1_9VIBR|nr:histone deacetylase [Vibrio viridaestus]RQW64177.1 histone deacetylase [Vibrio viridaestus]
MNTIPLIYHDIYSQLSLPENHRYPINKYRFLYEYLWEHQKMNQWSWNTPKPIEIQSVTRVHNEQYVHDLCSGVLPLAKMRRIGFPWSESLIQRTLTSAGGTLKTMQMALEHNVAIHLSGGYHHAHFDFGSGFCLFNDLVIAARELLSSNAVERILIIDSDVHHGDGTAALSHDIEGLYTLSFHCEKNFPSRKPDSTMDVPFSVGAEDDAFLETFMSMAFLAVHRYQPDLIIYDAGVDIHIDDELGYLNVSTDALYQRDHYLLSLAKQQKVPVGCVIGGGYRRDHRSLVPLHFQLFRSAQAVFAY